LDDETSTAWEADNEGKRRVQKRLPQVDDDDDDEMIE
jgi:hypothetical protein